MSDDLDLLVESPNGVAISYQNTNGGGGFLEEDANPADSVGLPSGGIDGGSFEENIRFPASGPPPLGTYEVVVSQFATFDIDVTEDRWEVRVFLGDEEQDSQSGTFTAASIGNEFSFEFELP